MLPEKLFSDPNFSMLCGILAKACILGKFHPQPSPLGKHSFIRLMRMPKAFEDQQTCDRGCGALTQHQNDKYSLMQFLIFFKEILSLSFPSTSTFGLNVVCALHKVTQSSYQLVQIHTFWYHQLFHYVMTCVESLSLFVAQHALLNNGVSHQMIPCIFFKFVPPINLSRQSNMCLSKPVPLTCNISAGTDPSKQYTSSPKGTFSNALEISFLHKFVKPSSVKHACFKSSEVTRENVGMGLDSSSYRHLQS
jgi:hypothetical protein